MKPRVDTSRRAGKEVRGRAQRRAVQRQRRGCQQSLPHSREQQTESAGLLAALDEGRMNSPQEHLDRALAGSEETMERVSEMKKLQRSCHRLSPVNSQCWRDWDCTGKEATFAHLALAFRCDVFTLQQRVQVETRAQDTAEENIQEELGQCRAALERLSSSCIDGSCKEVLEQLQCSLEVLEVAIKRATSAAVKMGAVHQEARMSRAAEVMVQHVENLKRHHLREHAELEEMKCLIQQNSHNRQLAETQDDAELRLRPHPLMRSFQQASARRRVSIAVIPKQLLPAASMDGQATLAGEPEGAQRQISTQRRKLEPPGQGNVVSEGLVAEAGSKELESSTGGEELGQLQLMFKESPVELWRPWLSLLQPYWVVFWLLLLSIAFLLLLHLLELQRLQPKASPKA
ncbi:inositol 1,4,5-triphosphate receptor associated 2-like isoform X2 [Cyrtonyx montezumae]|uniref:inositol 1,4,5-triphosphate receptor associated 2-like isoform X2 n=1 Tax=Cyrtonyx montezumae TaxID=9017 RepID=UPI0032DAD504